MRIVVWVREIPDTRDLIGAVLDAEGRPRWADWEGRFDPEDLNALEMALRVRDAIGGEVTALGVGEPRKMDVLRECLYRGADGAIRVAGGGDGEMGSLEEARLAAAAVKKMGDVDMLLTGIQLNEGEHAQRGALAARFLDWPLVSYVEELESADSGRVRLRRAIEGGGQWVETRSPAVVSVGVALLKDDPRAPRSAKAKLKLVHKKTEIPKWGVAELAVDRNALHAPIRAIAYRALEQRSFPSRRVDGSNERELEAMLNELRQIGVVR